MKLLFSTFTVDMVRSVIRIALKRISIFDKHPAGNYLNLFWGRGLIACLLKAIIANKMAKNSI